MRDKSNPPQAVREGQGNGLNTFTSVQGIERRLSEQPGLELHAVWLLCLGMHVYLGS